MNPDRNNFAPRVGVAWKAAKNTVVRAGYGINYNTAAYQNIVQNLAFQPPFSIHADERRVADEHLDAAERLSYYRGSHQQLRHRSELPARLCADLEPRHPAGNHAHADA